MAGIRIPLQIRDQGVYGAGVAPFGNVGLGLAPLYNPTNNILDALLAPGDDGSGNSPLASRVGNVLASIPEIVNDLQGQVGGDVNQDRISIIDLDPGPGIIPYLYNFVSPGIEGCFYIPESDELDLSEFSFFINLAWPSSPQGLRDEPWILSIQDEKTAFQDDNIFRLGVDAFSGEPPNIREVIFRYSTDGSDLDGAVVTNGANIVADVVYTLGFSYKDQGAGSSLLNIFIDGVIVASASDLPSFSALYDAMDLYDKPKPTLFGLFNGRGKARPAEVSVVMIDAAWMRGFINAGFTPASPVRPFRGTTGSNTDNAVIEVDMGADGAEWDFSSMGFYIQAALDAGDILLQYGVDDVSPPVLSSPITLATFNGLANEFGRYGRFKFLFDVTASNGYDRQDMSDGWIDILGVGTVPTPSIVAANDGDGEIVTVTISGSEAGSINILYFKLFGDSDWIQGDERIGDGELDQEELTNGRLYDFIVQSTASGSRLSVMSNLDRVFVSDSDDAIRELITQNMVATIESITTGGGFEIDIGEVVRYHRGTHNFSVFPGIELIALTGLERPKIVPAKEAVINFMITCWSELTDATQIDKQAMQVMEEIRKALMLDPKRGGFAKWTQVMGHDAIVNENQSQGGYVIRVDVGFSFRYDNGYVKAGPA